MARKAFAHDAVVTMQQDDSPNALGGAITKALCGGWDHPPPCPLAPHYVTNVAEGETVTLRVLLRPNRLTSSGCAHSSARRWPPAS